MAKLDLIDLDQSSVGYRKFLSCWVYRSDDLTYIVDPGPRSTSGFLVNQLLGLNIENIELILITHIHLDHGGCAAEIVKAFPGAKVYCHESGVKHLIDPSRLWKGSQEVLGEVAQMYLEPNPVAPESMATTKEVEDAGIQVIHTPGHAPHHVCFVHDDILFAGEAIGTRLPLPSGKPYMRPATPPRFFLDVALQSLDKIMALELKPSRAAMAHWGMVENPIDWCTRARQQLILWVDTLEQLAGESSENLEQRFFNKLMETDPFYGQGRYEELDDDLKTRERHFLGNTIDGMLGYLKSKSLDML